MNLVHIVKFEKQIKIDLILILEEPKLNNNFKETMRLI